MAGPHQPSGCLRPTCLIKKNMYVCNTGHPVSFDDFKILSCPFEFELLLRESLLIRNLELSLNANIGSAPLFLL